MTLPRVYYADQLMSKASQVNAADNLLCVLTLAEQLRGRLLTHLARIWGRKQATVHQSVCRARMQVYCALSNGRTTPDMIDPSMMPLAAIRSDFAKYKPVIDGLIEKFEKEIEDERTVDLIHGMFTDKPAAVYSRRRARRPNSINPRSARGPGRPLGSRNKVKDPPRPESEAWPMPDGFQIPRREKDEWA